MDFVRELRKAVIASKIPDARSPGPGAFFPRKNNVDVALSALRDLHMNAFHPSFEPLFPALLVLWPNIWQWIRFLSTLDANSWYGQNSPEHIPEVCTRAVSAMLNVCTDKSVVAHTPGVIAMALKRCMDAKILGTPESKCSREELNLLLCMTAIGSLKKTGSSVGLEEMLSVVDGSYTKLFKFVVKDFLRPTTRALLQSGTTTTMGPGDFTMIIAAMSLVSGLSHTALPTGQNPIILRSTGVINALVGAVVAFQRTPGTRSQLPELQSVYTALAFAFGFNGCRKLVVTALDSGLLQVVSSASADPAHQCVIAVNGIITLLIQMVIFADVRQAVTRAMSVDFGENTMDPVFHGRFIILRDLVVSLGRLKVEYPLAWKKITSMSCRRGGCMSPFDKKTFKKCSLCLEAYYCSRKCAKDDRQFHKRECQEIDQDIGEHHLSDCERQFVQLFTHHKMAQDYRTIQRDIIGRVLAAPASRGPFVAIMEGIKEGDWLITVEEATTPQIKYFLADDIARAAQGKCILALTVVFFGFKTNRKDPMSVTHVPYVFEVAK